MEKHIFRQKSAPIRKKAVFSYFKCGEIANFAKTNHHILGMHRSDFEIMAPVGSWESLTAAWQGGADAIYFGIENLNMRSRSSVNFTLDDLHTIAAWCQEHNMKSYLTVNTIIYEEDIEYMHSIVNAAKEAKVTAIIASDMATILYARSIDVEVHISTQVNVSNSEAMRYYAQWADVQVLARELNMDQVKAVHEAIVKNDVRGPHGDQVRIEMFCHGALCMAVSGKCYMSLHETGASANRGACRQICRRSYIVTDRDTGDELAIENKYIMSPKDLKTIHFLNKMIDAGVRVFKIEGRARGPEYVRTVVECYNEAINAIIDGTYTDEAWAEAEKKANDLLTEWQNGEHTEDSFAFMAAENSQDPGSVENGGLYEDIYPGKMVDEFDAWCFDPARQPGDTGIVETSYGVHVMYFDGFGNSYRDTLVENALRTADYNAWHDGVVGDNAYTTVPFGMKFTTK